MIQRNYFTFPMIYTIRVVDGRRFGTGALFRNHQFPSCSAVRRVFQSYGQVDRRIAADIELSDKVRVSLDFINFCSSFFKPGTEGRNLAIESCLEKRLRFHLAGSERRAHRLLRTYQYQLTSVVSEICNLLNLTLNKIFQLFLRTI